jgi:hypothetical protein
MALCGVCGKLEAVRDCSVCNIPLCEACTKEVTLEELTPAAVPKPGVILSPIRPGMEKKKVCPKCMKEVEFM